MSIFRRVLPGLPAVVLALGLSSGPAGAQPAGYSSGAQVAFETALFVEHSSWKHGRPVHAIEPASRLAHGDHVVAMETWYRLGGRGGFAVNNPIPHGLLWQASAGADGEVSVDGGRTWGRLGDLRVAGRPATGADVTNARWHVDPEAAETGSGTIAYAGVVR